jgi:hypothetical protein
VRSSEHLASASGAQEPTAVALTTDVSTTATARQRTQVSEARPRTWADPRGAWFVLAVIMLGTGAWMLYLTRGGTFHYDEWNFVMNRRGHSLDTFFLPHNDHIAALPVFLFKTLFETVGLAHYWPYQLMPIVLHLVCALLIYVLARTRLGEWWALVPAGLVVFFGAGANTILWPFQIGFLIPLAAFLGALLLVELDNRPADVVAAILLTAGVSSSGMGVPMAAGIAVYLLLEPRRFLRALGVVGIPLLLYLVWDQRYGVSQYSWGTVPDVPRMVVDHLAANLAALTGLPEQFGPALAIVFVLGVAAHVLLDAPLTRRLAAAATALLALFAVLSLFRPGLVGDRYLYPGGVLLILVLVELAAGYVPRRPSARVAAVGATALVLVLSSQLASFLDAGRYFRDWAGFVSTSLGALELARNRVEPTFRPDPVRAPDVSADQYFDVTEEFGSPAASPEEILRRPEDARANADGVLAAALRLDLRPAGPPTTLGPIPRPVAQSLGVGEPKAGCLEFKPFAPRSSVEVRVPAAGLWLRPREGANAEVRLRRFGDSYPQGDEPPGRERFAGFVFGNRDFIKPAVLRPPDATGTSLVIPRDRAPSAPWYAQLTTDQLLEACAIGS